MHIFLSQNLPHTVEEPPYISPESVISALTSARVPAKSPTRSSQEDPSRSAPDAVPPHQPTCLPAHNTPESGNSAPGYLCRRVRVWRTVTFDLPSPGVAAGLPRCPPRGGGVKGEATQREMGTGSLGRFCVADQFGKAGSDTSRWKYHLNHVGGYEIVREEYVGMLLSQYFVVVN